VHAQTSGTLRAYLPVKTQVGPWDHHAFTSSLLLHLEVASSSDGARPLDYYDNIRFWTHLVGSVRLVSYRNYGTTVRPPKDQ
jgi:hypothetical protein